MPKDWQSELTRAQFYAAHNSADFLALAWLIAATRENAELMNLTHLRDDNGTRDHKD